MANGIIQALDNNDARVEQWLHIDTWDAGIYDSSYISTAEPIISAPLGAASEVGTFCCASLGTGGLGPLPGTDYTTTAPTYPSGVNLQYIVGFAVNPGLAAAGDELIIMLESDSGTNHYYQVWSTIPAMADNLVLSSTSATVAGIFGSPYPSWTRVSSQPVIGDPGYVIPTPTLVFPSEVATDSHTIYGHVYLYPNPATPTAFSVGDIVVPGTNGTGQIICYGDRILVLAGSDYPWPYTGGVSVNENVDYTDPPESYVLGDQQSILVAEEPWGYGAWGSVSVGELLLIKKYGGGVQVIGDIDDPSAVIYLPGIQPTGLIVGKATANSLGLVYCSEGRGAWLWNGGNTSTKISPQLRDNFFDASSTQIPSNNYGFLVEHWQDWLLFSNNWLFNPDTGGWWRLFPVNGGGDATLVGQTFWWFALGRLGYQMYAAPLIIQDVTSVYTNDWFTRFNSTTPTAYWSWTSLPMHVVPTSDRVLDVRQVVMRLSSPDGSGADSATITIGSWTATTTGTIGTSPTTFRFNVGAGALALEDITVKITALNTGGGSAPILHTLDIGFSIRAGVATNN